MAISTYFQDEINAVDPSKTLVYVVNTSTYTEFQWSYSGLTITGGSDLACEYGASALLEAMGFRWYTPNPQFWKRPASIPTNLTAAKQQYWMPNNNVFLVYGHSFAGDATPSRTYLLNAMDKWLALQGFRTSVFPAGHRWGNIVGGNRTFFENNLQLLKGGAIPANVAHSYFDLTVTGEDYDNLVEICAAYMLSQGLNAYKRTNFDPSDGDSSASDLVFPFTKAVVDRMRAGTDPIGTLSAQTGVPDCQIGLYAYAGHRLPPTLSVSPGVYTQVALAFNSTALTYQQLIEGHGAKADAILLREYLSTEVWDHGQFLSNGRTNTLYFNGYDAAHAAGVVGITGELGANWLVNMVMMRWGIRKMKTGGTTYAEALAEIVADIFDDDEAVSDLYTLWSNPYKKFDIWTLRESFDHVNAMQAGWYKRHYQDVLTILYESFFMPPQTPLAQQDESDPFPAAFISKMGKAFAIRDNDVMHVYAKMRQEANSAVNTNYPYLNLFATPTPEWMVNPVAPTEADFDANYTALQALTVRDANLDGVDLVLVQGLVPRTTATAPSSGIFTGGDALYIFVGPGRLTATDYYGVQLSSEVYGSGIHFVGFNGAGRLLVNEGGFLFLDTFPSVRKDPGGTFHHWLYVPYSVEGSVDLRSRSRLSIVDQNGGINIYPANHASYVSPANIGPGQVRVDNGATRDVMENFNCNRYLSCHPNVALMPRPLAIAEGFGRGVVNVA